MHSTESNKAFSQLGLVLAMILCLGSGAILGSAQECVADSPAGCLEVASHLEQDDSSVADRERAVSLYRQACTWGSIPACVRAGHRLRDGYQVRHDPVAAAALFEGACEKGSAEGCNMLGLMQAREEGDLVSDLNRIRRLYQLSCSGGWGWGCLNSAACMRDGEGGPIDHVGAAENFSKACELGIANGCTSLGYLYWDGKGVEKDWLQANSYYARGCDNGSGWGCYHLGSSYRNGEGMVKKDPVQAASLLRKACDLEAARGCNLAGIMFHDGETGSQDRLLAFGLFHKACDDGYFWGCNNMANMYRDGRGIGKDQARAELLYRKACDGGIDDACAALGIDVATPTPTPPVPTPIPTATLAPHPPSRVQARPPAANRWHRNCQVFWKSENEIIYTVTSDVVDGQNQQNSWHLTKADLLALVNAVEVENEADLAKARSAVLGAIDRAPQYDNPLSGFPGGSNADMTMTQELRQALDALWQSIGEHAEAAGEPCPYLRFESDDGLVFDRNSGLEWRTGSDERTTRDEAIAWVEQLAATEGSWRLPSKDELHALFLGGLRPENLAAFFGITGTWSWSTAQAEGSPDSWGYSFNRSSGMVMTSCRFCESRAFAVRRRR